MATDATPAERPPAPAARSRERSIGAVWRDAVAAGRATPAYLVEEDAGWREVSWQEAGTRVDELASGLLALGLRKGDVLAILASTRLEWALLDFAAASIGVVVVPIYATSSARDCAYVLGHAEAVAVAVEDEAQRAKVESVRGELPLLRHVLAFAELDATVASGREHGRAALDEARAAVGEDDVLMVVYTSGTTGRPKGCVLLQRTYAAVVEMLQAVPALCGRHDVVLLFLPLAHTYAQLMLYAGAAVGFTIAFCPDAQRVAKAAERVRPTVLPSVPRLYEKVGAAVGAQLAAAAGARRRLADWALAVGREASRLRQAGHPLPPLLALQHRLADRLVYSKVKARLGGRLRFGVSGAAPLSRDVLELFHALDVLVLEGYGLTECASGCSVNRPGQFRFGTVGPPLPGVELRIGEDGEILIRSDGLFAGYLKDEEATRAAFTDDGWLRTGDAGELDADGFLTITDRLKDLIVLANGKNVAPQPIETELASSELVAQALVVGDRRPYLVALVALDEAELRRLVAERGLRGASAELAASEELRAAVQQVVDRVNRERAQFEQVRRFAILPRELSQEEGELTPTLKVRRGVVEARFANEIERLYRGRRSS